MEKINEKLLELINELTPANDKLAHFYWGFNYSILSTIFLTIPLSLMFEPFELFGLLPFIVTSILAWAKEVRDGLGYGHKSLGDFIWTIIPAIPISLMVTIISSYMI